MILYIALGGIIGTLARYFIGGWIQQKTGSSFPYQTLAVNLAGSFIVGFITRVATGTVIISPEMRGALTIGFCGAFTTMSTFSYESVRLMSDGEYFRAAAYGGSTILGCFAATFTGIVLAQRLL